MMVQSVDAQGLISDPGLSALPSVPAATRLTACRRPALNSGVRACWTLEVFEGVLTVAPFRAQRFRRVAGDAPCGPASNLESECIAATVAGSDATNAALVWKFACFWASAFLEANTAA